MEAVADVEADVEVHARPTDARDLLSESSERFEMTVFVDGRSQSPKNEAPHSSSQPAHEGSSLQKTPSQMFVAPASVSDPPQQSGDNQQRNDQGQREDQIQNKDAAAQKPSKLTPFWKRLTRKHKSRVKIQVESRKSRFSIFSRASALLTNEDPDNEEDVQRSSSITSIQSGGKSKRGSLYARNAPEKQSQEMSPWERFQEATFIYPDDVYLTAWEYFLGILILYTNFVIPYIFAFQLKVTGEWLAWDVFVDFVFIFNIFVTLRVGVVKDDVMLTGVADLFKEYLKSWLILDVISSIPFSLFPNAVKNWVFFKLPRLLRLAKMARLAKTNIWASTSNTYRVGILSINFALIAHWVGCAWYWASLIQDFDGSLFSATVEVSEMEQPARYLRAISWGFTSLSGLGGSLVPVTDEECILTVIVVMVAVFVFATIIGSINSAIANVDRTQARFRERLQGINEFMRYRRLPDNTCSKIRSYYERIWFLNQGLDEGQILEDLPRDLRMEVASHIYKRLLQKVPIFRNMEDTFMRALALRIRPELCLPGDYVFRFGERAAEMYFISSGIVEIIASDGLTVLAQLKEGAYFGEIAIMTNTTRTASVRAVELCELFILQKVDFDALLEQYPDVAATIREVAKERNVQRKQSVVKVNIEVTKPSGDESELEVSFKQTSPEQTSKSQSKPQPHDSIASPATLSSSPIASSVSGYNLARVEDA
eukprot:TRINITY_DN10293_c0_g1_i2.p1 TRINITY_DN10293_c0_g1~~TRINITY_DN10293_c0_g1_i2.p1  ORF type:complete len:711 (+),score=156.26 TRINITY_DN10293_c0_g1_i2:100-2232(+)